MDRHIGKIAIYLHPLCIFYPFFIAGIIYLIMEGIFLVPILPYQDLFFATLFFLFLTNFLDLKIMQKISGHSDFFMRFSWCKVDIVKSQLMSKWQYIISKILLIIALFGVSSIFYSLSLINQQLYLRVLPLLIASMIYASLSLLPIYPFLLGQVILSILKEKKLARLVFIVCSILVLGSLSAFFMHSMWGVIHATLFVFNISIFIQYIINNKANKNRISLEQYKKIYTGIKNPTDLFLKDFRSKLEKSLSSYDQKMFSIWNSTFLFRAHDYQGVCDTLGHYSSTLDEEGSVMYLRSLKEIKDWERLLDVGSRLFAHNPQVIYAQLNLKAALNLGKSKEAIGWLNFLYCNGWISIEDVFNASFLSYLRSTPEWDYWIMNKAKAHTV